MLEHTGSGATPIGKPNMVCTNETSFTEDLVLKVLWNDVQEHGPSHLWSSS